MAEPFGRHHGDDEERDDLHGDERGVDHELARQLRRQVGGELSEQRKRYQLSGNALTGDDERELARHLISEAVRGYAAERLSLGVVVPLETLAALERTVWSAMYEADRLQVLLNDDAVETIIINGFDQVFVIYADHRGKQRVGDIANRDAELIEMVRGLAAWVGLSSRPWDDRNPFLRLRLPDGARLSAVGWVCERPTISIRRNRFPRITLDDLAANGTCSALVAEFLRAAVRARLTIFFTGDQKAGKTTALRACAAEIDPDERIFTIEESLELDLAMLGKHDDVVALEARKSYGDGVAEVTLTDLVRETLTQAAERVIVGECKGPEVVALINATLGGSTGSMATIHTKTAKGVFNRIASLAVQSKEAELTSDVAHMLIAEAVELVVFLKAVRDKATGQFRRVVEEIIEVDGWNGSEVASSTLFKYNSATGFAEPQPALKHCRLTEVLAENGFDVEPGSRSRPGWQI
jgi:pilus assembly protein CpaF